MSDEAECAQPHHCIILRSTVEPAQSDTRSDKKNLSDKQFAGLERLKCIIRCSFMYRDYVGSR